jgi:hypothetical protein
MEKNNSAEHTSLFQNWISLAGAVLAAGSFFSFVLLFLFDLLAKETNPYVGILTFVVSPGFLSLGLLLIGLGWLLQRRSLARGEGGLALSVLSIDFARPSDRRKLMVFAVGTAAFLLCAAVGSYHTFHYVESVQFCGQLCHTPMTPEFTTYQHSPHARIGCTECHVGPGAASFVRAKLNGVHQLKATLLNSFDRPIKTPVKGMRLAMYTCENCHWPQKYIGNREKVFHRYLTDDENTPVVTEMLLKVGGGDPQAGPVGGIHWHMNLNNKVEYIASDEKRQTIPWVRFTNPKGEVIEFRATGFTNNLVQSEIRRMDCMDCHNRPAHQYRSPSQTVDIALSTGRLDAKLAAIKKNAVDALSKEYVSQADAFAKIADFLKSKYPKETKLDATIAEVQQIYAASIFPEMKVSWKAYPDNIGHKEWPGCFRCHDGQHKAVDGKRKIEASNCNDCHTILSQAKGADVAKLSQAGMKFAHPDAADEGTDPNCTTCHSATQ